MIPLIFNLIFGHFTNKQSTSDNQVFKNYEAFSKKVVPANFVLTDTKYEPFGVDMPPAVDQTFRISSTRKAITEEFKQRLESKGYSFRPAIYSSGSYSDGQYFFRDTTDRIYPAAIQIVFTPSDTICNNPSPDVMMQCVSHNPLSTVTEVNIAWEARVGD